MKVEKLIKELQKLPAGIEVCIGDYKKNVHHADGEPEGCGEGIYKDFNVDLMEKEEIPKGSKPWASLTFDSKYGED
jgi:hypothetical protein